MDFENIFFESFKSIPLGQHLYIYGAGGRGTFVYNLMQRVRPDITVVGFITSHENGTCCGMKVITIDELKIKQHEAIILASYAGSAIYAEILKRNLKDYLLLEASCASMSSECMFLITSQCNSNCIFCTFSTNSTHKIDGAIRKEWTENYIKTSFKVASRAERIQLTGGEPLLHPEIQQFSQWACENNKIIEVITNGIALSSKKIMDRVVPNLGQLSVSFASPDKIIQADLMPNTDPDMLLKRLQQAKHVNERLRIHMNLIIHKKTLETIDLLANYLCRAKVDSITFSTLNYDIHSHPRVRDQLALISQQDKDEAQEKVYEIACILEKNAIAVDNAFTANASCNATSAVPDKVYTKKCVYPWTRTFIGLDGTIWPCCNAVNNPALTTLEHYGDLPAKRAELQRNFLDGKLPEACRRCITKPACTKDELIDELFKI